MNEQPVTVLVTAIGGCGPGDQLYKALKEARRTRYRVIGADIKERVPQFEYVDQAVTVPRASDPAFVNEILRICEKYQVQALLTGSEAEIEVLSRHEAEFARRNIFLPIQTPEVLEVCLNKDRTAAFLEENGFRFPRTVEIRDGVPAAPIDFFPVVLKPSVGGGGSRGLYLAQNARQLSSILAYLDELKQDAPLIVQEYIGTPDDEYTVGVLSDMDGNYINSIAVRRDLTGVINTRLSEPNVTGNSSFGPRLVISSGVSQGTVGRYPLITSQCAELARALGSRGAINVQLRLVGDQIYVFEINPRFSGTTPLRAMAGYNEPDILIRQHLYGELPETDFAYSNLEIVRTLTETALTDVPVDRWVAANTNFEDA